MSESEKLKEQAIHQELKDRAELVEKYLTEHIALFQQQVEKNQRWALIEFGALIVMVVGVFTHELVWFLGFTSFFGCIIYGWHLRTELRETAGKLEGAFDTLRMLGFLSDEEHRRRRQVKVKESKVAKAWERAKQLIRQKAYAS